MTTKILVITTVLFFFSSIYFYVQPQKGLREYKEELDEALHTIKLNEQQIKKLMGELALREKALNMSEDQINRMSQQIGKLERENLEVKESLRRLTSDFQKFKLVFAKP